MASTIESVQPPEGSPQKRPHGHSVVLSKKQLRHLFAQSTLTEDPETSDSDAHHSSTENESGATNTEETENGTALESAGSSTYALEEPLSPGSLHSDLTKEEEAAIMKSQSVMIPRALANLEKYMRGRKSSASVSLPRPKKRESTKEGKDGKETRSAPISPETSPNGSPSSPLAQSSARHSILSHMTSDGSESSAVLPQDTEDSTDASSYAKPNRSPSMLMRSALAGGSSPEIRRSPSQKSTSSSMSTLSSLDENIKAGKKKMGIALAPLKKIEKLVPGTAPSNGVSTVFTSNEKGAGSPTLISGLLHHTGMSVSEPVLLSKREIRLQVIAGSEHIVVMAEANMTVGQLVARVAQDASKFLGGKEIKKCARVTGLAIPFSELVGSQLVKDDVVVMETFVLDPSYMSV